MLNSYLLYVILPTLSIAAILVFVRFLKGPFTLDRVVGLDFLINIGIGIIAIYSVVTDHSAFLDVAMILALIAFLGTVALSYYLEQRGKQ